MRLRRLKSVKTPGLEYATNLDDLLCDCGRPTVSGLPCAHLHAHARLAGLSIASFMHTPDTRRGWEAQYPQGLCFPCAVTTAQVEQKLTTERGSLRDFVLPQCAA